jgi:hypothetical protein
VRTFASFVAGFLALVVVAPAVSAIASIGWPEMTDSLTQLRSRAQSCVEVLKSGSDKAAIMAVRITYGDAKAAAEGVITGLTTTLVEGGKPGTLPNVQANVAKAGAGLKEVCDAAIKTASAGPGTKGVLDTILKAPLEPIISAISSGVAALWTRRVEKDKLELETIKTQLEAAKWPNFGDVAPAQ